MENAKLSDGGHVLLFDGVCVLCSRLVQFMAKRDKKSQFRFIALQSASGKSLLTQYGLPEDFIESVVYISNGRLHLKSSAILYMLKDMGGVWRLPFIFMAFPRFIRDPVYDIIAHSRYKFFGKSASG